MSKAGFHAVTGAYGFTGRYIAQRLLDAGRRVITLTNSPMRANPFGGRVAAVPYNFESPGALAASLGGAGVLYNTYWIRFSRRGLSHETAVENTRILFNAARQAGVRRIVHVSITNVSEESPLGYFRSKAILERALAESGISHAILRPALLFGPESILVNNIAWMLRRFPAFALFGDGSYRLQPIHVDDLAKLAVEQGSREENSVIDAVGPETYTYRQLVEMIAEAIGRKKMLVPVPPLLGYMGGFLMGKLLGDIVMTRDELRGLMGNLLCTNSPATGATSLKEWTRQNAAGLGMRYAGELVRRLNREKAYADL